MPRRGNITFVPVATAGGPVITPMNLIPDEIKSEAEEVYAALKANPNGRMMLVFDTKDEADEYANLVNSYCQQRTIVGDNGEQISEPIRFRRSPVKGQPSNVLNFRITDVMPEKDAKELGDTQEIPVVQDGPAKRTARKTTK